MSKVWLIRAHQEDHHKASYRQQNGSRLEDDVEDKPAWPGPAIVPAQQDTQREEQAPGRIHEDTMEMEEGESR